MTRFSILLALVGCGGDVPEGQVTASIYGEDFVELGIPASMFGDGWSLRFDNFLVSVGEVEIEGEDRAGSPGYRIVNLAAKSRGKGYEIARFDAPQGAYRKFRYTVGPAADAVPHDVAASDAQAMTTAGYSVWIAGVASKGNERRAIDLGFRMAIAHDCGIEAKLDQRLGIQATFHGDHLLFDATEPEPYLRFQAIADADDGDGIVRNAELAAVDIRGNAQYRAPGVVNLEQFLESQLTSVGHVNGEGGCTRTVRR